jgi:hypothetical protein
MGRRLRSLANIVTCSEDHQVLSGCCLYAYSKLSNNNQILMIESRTVRNSHTLVMV